jgi:hypothetical protein
MFTKSLAFILTWSLLSTAKLKIKSAQPLNQPETPDDGTSMLDSSSPLFLNTWEKKLQKMTCNRKLLELFDVPVPEDWSVTPTIAHHKARQVCRRNRVTCCSFNQLTSVKANLELGKQRLKAMMEPVHEMLAMFVGKISDTFFSKIPLIELKKKGCAEAMGLYGADGAGADFFYSKKSRTAMRAELQGLFGEFPIYFKKVLRFFRNFVCSVCHPREKDFLELTPTHLKITASLDSCAGIIDMHEYELRLAHAYKHLVEPMVRAAHCFKTGKLERESKPFLGRLVKAEHKAFTCLTDMTPTNKDCKDICQRDVFALKLQFQLLGRATEALEVLFKLFSHVPIDEFYERTKNHKFRMYVHQVNFYPQNDQFPPELQKRVLWSLAEEGLSLFTDHFSVERFEGVKREDDI